jgi:hypothetical protein
MKNAETLKLALDRVTTRKNEFFGKRTISAGIVGDECDAKIALKFRSMPSVPATPKLNRMFDLGHDLEDRVLSYIGDAVKNLGGTVAFRNFAGDQWQFRGRHDHLKVKVDGLIEWPEVDELLEIKSASQSRFNAMEKKGVLKAEQKYWDQAQMAMALSGIASMKFVVYCKNTSRLYVEDIKFDPDRWSFLEAKIDRVMTGEARRVSSNPTNYHCTMCDMIHSCWSKPAIHAKNRQCHHCAHAYPDVKQEWWCTLKGKPAKGVCPQFKMYRPLTSA